MAMSDSSRNGIQTRPEDTGTNEKGAGWRTAVGWLAFGVLIVVVVGGVFMFG
jgi:hypothetical protein